MGKLPQSVRSFNLRAQKVLKISLPASLERNSSHAKAQRRKEVLRNTAVLCVFAPLREKPSLAPGTFSAKRSQSASVAELSIMPRKLICPV